MSTDRMNLGVGGTDAVGDYDLGSLVQVADLLADSVEFADREGRLLHVNPAFERLLGWTRDDVVGRTPGEFLRSGAHPVEFFEAMWRETLAGSRSCHVVTTRRKDGSNLDVEMSISPLLDRRGLLSLICVVRRDATALTHSIAALRSSEERFALAAAASQEGIWDWSVGDGTVSSTARFQWLCGSPAEAPTPQVLDRWLLAFWPPDRGPIESALRRHAAGEDQAVDMEVRVDHPAGPRWCRLRGIGGRTADGRVVRIAGSLGDVHERRLAEDRLRHAALHDALTGLPNRVLLEERVQHALAYLRRGGPERVGILFIDLDRFKLVNDTQGHGAGDQLLQEVASRIVSAVRPSDTVARLGGDEFIVLLERVRDEAAALDVAQRVLAVLHRPITLPTFEATIGASVGVALAAGAETRPSDLLADGDTAMYQAKSAGRGRAVLFRDEMRKRVRRRVQIEAELRAALRDGGIEPWFQPVVDLDTGQWMGVEALARWQRGDAEPVGAGDFVPIADECGLLDDLTRTMLLRSFAALSTWRSGALLTGRFDVAVNLTAAQLANPDVFEACVAAVRDAAVTPRDLLVEVTESELLSDERGGVVGLRRFQQHGFRVAIDDFGTGWSSLAQLRRLTPDVLKIDRSFVHGASADTGARAVLRAIAGLAQGLSIELIAEGVERDDDRSLLCDIGVGRAQGYLFARPLPSLELESRLRSRLG